MIKRIHYEIGQLHNLSCKLGLANAVRFRLAKKLNWPLVKVKVNGISLYLRPRSYDLNVAISSLGTEFESLSYFLDPDYNGIIIDAGGYIGTTSLQFSRMFPKATVVVIEASPANFNILKKNVARVESIIPINQALSSVSGKTLKLHDRGTGEWGHTVIGKSNSSSKASNAREITTVNTISLSEVMARYSSKEISLIKIDIEGAEKDLFENSSVELDKIAVIAVELHDKIIEGCRTSFESYSKNRNVYALPGEKFLAVNQKTYDAQKSVDRSA